MLYLDERILLRKTPTKKLVKWWCELNRWGWPEDLGKSEPAEFRPISESKRTAIMDYIQFVIADRTISREWNKDMTKDEFNQWYTYHGGAVYTNDKHSF